jgi:hypothetical protein
MAPHPPRTVNLDHRALHLRGAPRQSLLVAAAGHGAATFVNVDSGQTQSVAVYLNTIAGGTAPNERP